MANSPSTRESHGSKLPLAERRRILATIVRASVQLHDAGTEILRSPAGAEAPLSCNSQWLSANDNPTVAKGLRMTRAAVELVQIIDQLAPILGLKSKDAFEFLQD